ncbi:MAG TPA: hypothetical protein ENI31_06870 [Candidatus Omnitrophica bacterium]|nr:MAG: hypothetical protein DRP69_00535 [Candidatus Omnitrophota bacterium]RKY44576.1 MAG: hypothetical protein DRP80_01890 [Candidatus Omnitrophota bacterium]HEC69985.1 hypothetical protein [Candidatus Omnitrophota bacterium]
MQFISYYNFRRFLERLSKDFLVYTPQFINERDYDYSLFKEGFIFNPYRLISSPRQFFTASSSLVVGYFDSKIPRREIKPFAIVGLKSCDLYSLKIQDYVFLEGDFVDEEYKKKRETSLIISSDCTSFKDVCFCLNLEIKPYPQEGFDFNLSDIDRGFLVEIGSEKAKRIWEDNKDLFEERKDLQARREEKRKKIIEDLEKHLSSLGLVPQEKLYQLVKNNHANPLWQDTALSCVECGACIMNCPTCHCFLLSDEERKGEYFRGRIWDGCQYKNFARVAGGANPLKLRAQRLRNRYIKKFEFFKERIDLYACTGCGRCIDSCIAKIDLREIFKALNA